MATGDITFFEESKKSLADGTLDLDTQTFKLAILRNTVTPTASDATPNYSDYSANEVTNAGSYTTGGNTLTCTWTESGGTATFATSTTSTWASNGGNSVDARWGLIYESVGGYAIAFVDLGAILDMSTGDLTVNSGTIFTLT